MQEAGWEPRGEQPELLLNAIQRKAAAFYICFPSILLPQTRYSKPCKTKENVPPVSSAIIFHCFSSLSKRGPRKRLWTLLSTTTGLPYCVYRH